MVGVRVLLGGLELDCGRFGGEQVRPWEGEGGFGGGGT